MKQYYCLNCQKPKSAYGVRCIKCARAFTFSDPNSLARRNMSEAHKGNIPTNLVQLQSMLKGNKYCVGRKPWNEGMKDFMTNDKSPHWKGDKVGYSALHTWVRHKLGTPKKCTECGFKSDNVRQFHWANISREYRRDLTDWVRLCVKCHMQYDRYNIPLMKIGG